jgi:toxin FitB
MTEPSIYLLDTNIISELRKTKPHGAVIAWIRSVGIKGVAIPGVVIAEIQAGIEITRVQDESKAAEIDSWLGRVIRDYKVIPMDVGEFRERAKLMHGKRESLSRDGMIAATARLRTMTVATRNVKDFTEFDVRVFNPFQYVEETSTI